MVFSSPLFLFLFLPAVLAAYFLFGKRARNTVLLCASLLFYAWGESELVVLLLVSIAANYVLARAIQARRGTTAAKLLVAGAVVTNLAFLGWFKYTDWLWESAVAVLTAADLPYHWLGDRPGIHLPLGISFFTFQALSAIVDVYRGDVEVRRHPLEFALYVSCFPQLVAGPIVRYRDVAEQIARRGTSFADFALGARRFLVGLGKKVLLADTIGGMVDQIYGVPAEGLGASAVWLGLLGFGFQVYFDFSGYSDMAIGLGRMFGFHYLENFRYPFVSKSIREFWQRWHISLSSWFRDYVYFPLGGSRRGPLRTYLNLVAVFVLVGLWHGAAWSFVVFGLYHGVFMALERGALGRFLDRRHPVVQHAYFALVLTLGWTIFRARGMEHTGALLAALVPGPEPLYTASLFLTPDRVVALVVGFACSFPLLPWARARLARAGSPRLEALFETGAVVALLALLLLSVASLSASTLNPFIYFRF